MHAWPHVRQFAGDALAAVKMPVGGIGTGCISVGGRGQLVDWELFNRPGVGFNPAAFFAVDLRSSSLHATRVLESELGPAERSGPGGSEATMHGLPRFRRSTFAHAYPLGQVHLTDPDLPVTADLHVFNPLVPGDADASGAPALSYRADITNTGDAELAVSVCANMQNVAGAATGKQIRAGGAFRLVEADGVTTLLGSHSTSDAPGESDGTVGLSVLGDVPASHRLNWAKRTWGDSLLEFWDDFTEDGRVTEPDVGADTPTGTLTVGKRIAPGETVSFRFLITWHFPHRRAWTHAFDSYGLGPYSDDFIGNHYCGMDSDAAAVAARLAPRLAGDEQRTIEFVRKVADALPASVADAALANLAVLKSPTCFRTADGRFYAWEGCWPHEGSCHGSCTHVWNYQYALERLFPELAWSMRRTEFVDSLDERGMMSFRTGLPAEKYANAWPTGAADGQMGAIVRMHRLWKITGDDARLAELWPGVRSALEFAWIPGGWDADKDGLMEGCQHNTMDVEYYGPSGVIQSWYLAALAAGTEMARALGCDDFADDCERVLTSGARLTDSELFNGDYYRQRVIPAGTDKNIADGLRIRYPDPDADVGSEDLESPDLQIAGGCTADQLVGHAMAALGGLDTRLDPARVRTAMGSVYRFNHRDDFHGHFNHMRTFAAGDEAGLLVCTFPYGDRPARPLPYCNEVWTGLEYSAAIGLILAGRRDEGLRVVADVRSRYDGRARNPFDEVECGSHYVRSMASWGVAEALGLFAS
ncbi:GH116 family glycosyl-hydrolase [Spelaeicoccus albus]|uniref:Uncharacterized protein (DUF608 family) n=1 Tax=Spelaeicoccus albus TaxID=1280376 RepID=A0A7Z0D5T5_9MICO|nr:GH116 family glycosyl-hydrolase [Spelaeicoccus albus]NYI69417.1 uncharacterized protein (DUF608 family) [Spelaeicoccus albus]